jgi:polar amino acid transport system substrate-binding protein
MKRALFLTLAAVMVLSLALTGCASSNKKEITVAVDATWPPFESVNEQTKKMEGFDIELMEAIAKDQGFTVKWVAVGFDPLLAGMATGTYDAAISVITITDDRKAKMDFSDPYYAAGQLICVAVNNETIKTAADLKGKKAGGQVGTTGIMEIEKVQGAVAKTYDDVSQAFLDLMNGQIDAVVADSPLVYGYVAKNSTKIKAVGQPFTDENYGIAVKKGNQALLDKINKGLKNVKDNGTLAKIDEKWVKAKQ